MILLASLIFLVVGITAGWFIQKTLSEKSAVPIVKFQELVTQKAVVESEVTNLKKDRTDLQAEIKSLYEKQQTSLSDIAELKTALNFNEEKLDKQKMEYEQMGQLLESNFKVLANSILDDRSKRFTELQENNLKILLEPFRQNIQTFKQEFESRYNKESEERISLREQVKHMMELNKTLSEQANNLTRALRGQTKQQGNWGEMILETILEYSGLQRDIHYFVQERTKNAAGDIIQPDVIVRYPDNRAIVIDSKVSLLHYEHYNNATDTEQQTAGLTMMLRSLRTHIDGLSARSYYDIPDALDFVIMFVPVEGAYITAVQADNTLWQYAYAKRVLLISPTNLIAAMKLVSDMWQRDSINRDAHKIAEKAGKLYDKLVGFVDNLQKVGDGIKNANKSWELAYSQLSTGKGNIITRMEQIKRYGAKTKKNLPENLLDDATIEGGDEDDNETEE